MLRAQEMLARQEETSEAEKNKLLQQALEKARFINRFPSEFKDGSAAMIQKLMVSLNREPGDPKDFPTAFGVAENIVTDVRRRLQKIREAQGSEQMRLLDELQPVLKEAARILQIGLSVVGPKMLGHAKQRVRAMADQWERWARRTHAIPWPWQPAYSAKTEA